MLDALADAFKESPEADALDECATVRPINVSSGDATRYLTAGGDWPNENHEPLADACGRRPRRCGPSAWRPRHPRPRRRARVVHPHAGRVRHARDDGACARLARRAEIGITDIERLCRIPRAGGASASPLWGSFKISKTNPNTSTTGLSAILMQSYEASGKTDDLTADDVAAAADFSRVFEECVIHYGDTTGKVLTTLYDETQNGAGGSGYVSAVALEETSLLNYNQGNPDSHTVQPGETLTPPKEKLVAVYPEGGSMWSDNPVTVLGADWVTDGAARSRRGVRRLPADRRRRSGSSRRTASGRSTTPCRSASCSPRTTASTRPKPAVTLPQPAVDVVSAAIDQWTQIRKPSSVLEVIDISGSMDEPIGDGRSKLDGAIEGAQATLGHFRSTDEVGVWAFTTGVESAAGENIVVLRDVSPLGVGSRVARLLARRPAVRRSATARRCTTRSRSRTTRCARAPSPAASTRSSCSPTARTPTRRSRSTR